MPKIRRPPPGRDDRGVKNLPKRRGVTEGFRFSFRCEALEGESEEFAGDDVPAGGLEGKPSDRVDGPW